MVMCVSSTSMEPHQGKYLHIVTVTAFCRVFSQLLSQQLALEESQLNEKQLRHKLEVQTETLNYKMEELRVLNEHTQSSMTSEMMEVQMTIMELENIKVRGS